MFLLVGKPVQTQASVLTQIIGKPYNLGTLIRLWNIKIIVVNNTIETALMGETCYIMSTSLYTTFLVNLMS